MLVLLNVLIKTPETRQATSLYCWLQTNSLQHSALRSLVLWCATLNTYLNVTWQTDCKITNPVLTIRVSADLPIFFRSSLSEVFYKKCAFQNLENFTGKLLCKSLFFNKVTGHRCFPTNFLRRPFYSASPMVASGFYQ